MKKEFMIWSEIEKIMYSLVKGEKDLRVKHPKIYEYKIGNSWIYYPALMIEVYLKNYKKDKSEIEIEELRRILDFFKNEIQHTKIPWVSWKTISNNAALIAQKRRYGLEWIWSIMHGVTYSFVKGEKEPKAKHPKIYEYKIGNSWIYYPALMIEEFTKLYRLKQK